ncbi:MAG: VacJ family lipoprotein [Marinibacterium sp.]|nr:VacJ family lipoprotein [Marinibacterium sp.]
MFWRSSLIVVAFSTTFLFGCATQKGANLAPGEVFDPYEVNNRGTHAFNLEVDKLLFRPAAVGYTNVVPDPIEDSFNAFARNLGEPGDFVNSLLQGRPDVAGVSLFRFVINTTIGFGGLADAATDFGIPETDTDFGETLHVWGFGEGAYIELPFYGPSTTRDAVGVVADLFTNPVSFTFTRAFENPGFYAEIVERLSDRGRYSSTVDSILYESADSYAQARLIYLQNRRFELEALDDSAYIDPYDDPYLDIYEDPYAE